MYRFDNKNREVLFSRYDNMPTPWMNYLSNGEFHTMMSQAGGGVAFYKSPQIWRINHYRFFHLPTDRSGFYTYIKDGDSVWCPTCEPCPEKPESWEGAHGMGYTRFTAKQNGVQVKSLYFVGKKENCLIWNLKICSATNKEITVFPYVEPDMMEFMRKRQTYVFEPVRFFGDKAVQSGRYRTWESGRCSRRVHDRPADDRSLTSILGGQFFADPVRFCRVPYGW